MPNGRKISQFPAAAGINNADVVGGVQNGVSTKFSFATIFLWLKSVLIPSDIGAVPTTRTVNGKSLTNDISLNATDVGARDASWMPSATDVGARPDTWTPSAADVGAIPTTAKGAPLGVAELDSNGQVPSSQLDLSGKQDEITASGILKGDGAGGVSAATAGTDYQAPLTIDSTPTASSTNPVQSGGVYTDVRTRVPNYGKGKNILRNWYWKNPVNQRGQNSYTFSSASYGIDAWKMNRGTITITSSGLVCTWNGSTTYQTNIQNIQNYGEIAGKTITMSALSSDGTLYKDTFTVVSSGSYVTSSGTVRFAASATSQALGVNISSTTGITIVAVKAELGSEQTLPHQEGSTWVLNEIPDYEYELYRCITSTADSSDTYANKSLATEQQLAYVETGTTASRAYAVGEYFCWNGLLYRVTAAISSGGTFTPGTNCEQVTEGGMNKLQSIVHPSSLILTYSLIGIPLVRASSSQRKLVITVPYGYTSVSVSMQSTNILTREFGSSTSATFSVTSVTASLSGYCLSVALNGTGLESAMDVLALDNGLVISLS